MINSLQDIIKEKFSDKYKECQNKNVMQPSTQVWCEELLLDLESLGFINLIPEEMDTFKLFIYLLFANKIIFSVGSVLYTNKIFFNYDAKLYYMRIEHCHWLCMDDYLFSKCIIYDIPNSNNNNQIITIQKNTPEYISCLTYLNS